MVSFEVELKEKSERESQLGRKIWSFIVGILQQLTDVGLESYMVTEKFEAPFPIEKCFTKRKRSIKKQGFSVF